LVAHFPHEKNNINRFFNFITKKEFLYLLGKTRKITFEKFIDSFFSDYKLKAILSIPLISIGLPPSRASALVAIILFREFVFDGGYYPRGGVQIFPDTLVAQFKKLGGKIIFSNEALRIITERKKIKGIKTRKIEFLESKIVVSNINAHLTFDHLLDCETKEQKVLRNLQVSTSAFVVFLGINDKLNLETKFFSLGCFFDYDIEKCYNMRNIVESGDVNYFFCMFPSLIDSSLAPKNRSNLRIFIEVDFIKKDLWNTHFNRSLEKKLIKKVSIFIPELENKIDVKEIASPLTYNRYTFNKNGALFGWAALPSQVDSDTFPYYTSIENLFLVGHWVTNGIGQSGVAIVALSGKNLSRKIIKTIKKER